MSEESSKKKVEETIREARAAIEDASFDVLIKKPRRETEFYVTVAGDDGRPRQVRLRYRALSPKHLDELLVAHAPTSKQQREGLQWNRETFPPALVSAVSLVPKMTEEQARDLLESDSWAPGEAAQLFSNAWAVCNAGLDVPFNAGD